MRGNEIIQGKKKIGLIRCYRLCGSDELAWDNFTVVYMDRSPVQKTRRTANGPLYECVGLSGHSEAVIGKHLGKRIPFAELPDGLRRTVVSDLGV